MWRDSADSRLQEVREMQGSSCPQGDQQRAEILKILPAKAGPMTEANWVAAYLGMRKVNLYSAPSRAAVHLLAALKKDDKLRRSFWINHLKTRLKRCYD